MSGRRCQGPVLSWEGETDVADVETQNRVLRPAPTGVRCSVAGVAGVADVAGVAGVVGVTGVTGVAGVGVSRAQGRAWAYAQAHLGVMGMNWTGTLTQRGLRV